MWRMMWQSYLEFWIERERDGSACMRRHQASAPVPRVGMIWQAQPKKPGKPAAKHAPPTQGLTLVHFSAQRKRFLWDRCTFRGRLECEQGVSRGIRGCLILF